MKNNNGQLEVLQKILNTQLKDLHNTSVKSKELKMIVTKSREVSNLSDKILRIVSMKNALNAPKKK